MTTTEPTTDLESEERELVRRTLLLLDTRDHCDMLGRHADALVLLGRPVLECDLPGAAAHVAWVAEDTLKIAAQCVDELREIVDLFATLDESED